MHPPDSLPNLVFLKISGEYNQLREPEILGEPDYVHMAEMMKSVQALENIPANCLGQA